MARTLKQIVSDWADYAQDGDVVKFSKGEVVILNSLGAEIVREDVLEERRKGTRDE